MFPAVGWFHHRTWYLSNSATTCSWGRSFAFIGGSVCVLERSAIKKWHIWSVRSIPAIIDGADVRPACIWRKFVVKSPLEHAAPEPSFSENLQDYCV